MEHNENVRIRALLGAWRDRVRDWDNHEARAAVMTCARDLETLLDMVLEVPEPEPEAA